MDANQNHQNSDLDLNKPPKNGGSIPLSVSSHSSKKSYFQITSVHEDIAPAHMLKEKSESREDIDDSILEGDKLESIDGKIIPPLLLPPITANSNITPTLTTSIKSSSNAPAPRFKVVKIPNQVPYKKGRWTCTDSASTSSITAPSTTDIILSNNKSIKKSLPNVSKIHTTTISNTSLSNGVGVHEKLPGNGNVSKADTSDIIDKPNNVSTSNMTCVQDSNYMVRDVLKNKNAHDILCSNLNFVNNSVFVTTCHTIIFDNKEKLSYMEAGDGHLLDNDLKFDNNVAQLNYHNIEASLYEEAHLPMLSTNSKLYSVLSSHTSPSSAYFEDYWKNLKLETISEKFTGSLEELATSSNQAIDNKIELAMDLVKSHLRLAVKSEMDCLRERVRELTLLNERLELENNFLRSRSAPDMLVLPSVVPSQKTLPASGLDPDTTLPTVVSEVSLPGDQPPTTLPQPSSFLPALTTFTSGASLSKSSSQQQHNHHSSHNVRLLTSETPPSRTHLLVSQLSSPLPTTSAFVLSAAISEIFSPTTTLIVPSTTSSLTNVGPGPPSSFIRYESGCSALPYPPDPSTISPLKSPPPPQNRGTSQARSSGTFYFSSAGSATTYGLSSASPPVASCCLDATTLNNNFLATPLPSLVNHSPIMSSHVWTSPPPSRTKEPPPGAGIKSDRLVIANGPTTRDTDLSSTLTPPSCGDKSHLGLNGFQEHEHGVDTERRHVQPKATKSQQSNGYPTHLKDHPPSKTKSGAVEQNSADHKNPSITSYNPTR